MVSRKFQTNYVTVNFLVSPIVQKHTTSLEGGTMKAIRYPEPFNKNAEYVVIGPTTCQISYDTMETF